MALQVVMGATCQCSFGVAPSVVIPLPTTISLVQGMQAVSVMDNIPMVNIPPFGMCTSLANPTVATATTAALGVLTPMPCIPVTSAPWMPGSPQVMVGGVPALNDSSKLMCNWGGMISITFPGQVQVQIP